MKIITNNAVYVQKNDIAYLNLTDFVMPASIFIKVFCSGSVIINDRNRFEFVEFNDSEEIDFFKGIDWMIDYNEVKDLSETDIIKLGQSIEEERNSVAQRFNSLSPEKREKKVNILSRIELLDFKIHSLRDILWFKQGYLKMKLPKGVDFPTGYEKKDIKKVIKTLFNKKNN